MSDNIKTNAFRMIDKKKISYKVHTYEAGDKIDGISVAEKLGQDVNKVFKTLVTHGKSGNYFVFVVPVAEELDLKKCAKSVGEKSVEMIAVKDLLKTTGYIRGGCSPVGMKKQFKTVFHITADEIDSIIVSGGRIGLQMELKPADLISAVNGQTADIIMNNNK